MNKYELQLMTPAQAYDSGRIDAISEAMMEIMRLQQECFLKLSSLRATNKKADTTMNVSAEYDGIQKALDALKAIKNKKRA